MLVNGVVRGVWSYAARRGQTAITVRLFSPASARIKRGIAAEAERLRAIFKTDVAVEYEESI